MFPYDLIANERETYRQRIAKIERECRHMQRSEDHPGLWERTTFRLGDLLIAAGEQLKHQRHEQKGS
jgi:hypothetical protein